MPIKGSKMNGETKIKISLSKKGKKPNRKYGPLPKEQKDKISLSKKGCKPTPGCFKKDMVPWNKKNFGATTYKELNHNLRTSKRWVQWRQEVFERDQYVCQTCGKTNTTLHPHHIVGVKQCVEIHDIDLIYTTRNGLTLCVDCHKDEHRNNNS